jgi:chromosome segregation ATPase
MLSAIADVAAAPQSNLGLFVAVLSALIGSAGLVAVALLQSRKSDKATSSSAQAAEDAGKSADAATVTLQQIIQLREEERHLRDETRDLYDILRREYDSLLGRMDRCEQENSQQRREIEDLQADNTEQRRRITHLEEENEDLRAERDRLRRRVRLLSEQIIQLGGHLPAEEMS